MKPYVHSKIHARKWGGVPEDYLPINDFLDCTKMALPDVRHRMMLHNSVGCYIAERIFGTNITNSDGKLVSVRDIAESHIIEDIGRIPTLEQCFKTMSIESWMSGGIKTSNKIMEEMNLKEDTILD